jgi:UDP-3-O-[3-hydroxymyristoyl] glucosamine N-acyltransferase
MKLTIKDLTRFLGKNLIAVLGSNKDAYVDNLADVEHTNEHTLDWVMPNKTNKQEIVEASKAKCLLVDAAVLYTETLKEQGKVLMVVKEPKRSLAEIGNQFFVEKPQAGIHPTAIISNEATIGESVYIGPYCIIGKAIIGDNCVIDSNVRIYDGVTMGRNCSIKSGAVLGGEGFGFERDSEGNKFRFPQLGHLIMGDDVEVGGNTCIDRGALSDTIIGDHTKINNLCHIAHNNKIGRNVTITGCVNVSGSNTIEDDVWIAPNASIKGFVHIGKGAVVGMGAVVTKSIPDNETWIGNPAHKMDRK